jgi:hypothetical protein
MSVPDGLILFLAITVGIPPTIADFKSLWIVVRGFLVKCPSAPTPSLRVIHGVSRDVVEVRGVDSAWAQELTEEWLARHGWD